MERSSDICNQLYELAKSHNGRNVDLDLNGVPVLVIQRLEDADYILRLNAENYRKNMDWFRQALGPSRFSEDGKAWEIRRDLTQPYFNKFDRERTFRLAAAHGRIALDKMIARSAKGLSTLDDDIPREMMCSIFIENFFEVKLSDTPIDLGLIAKLVEYGSEYSFVPAGQTKALYRDRLSKLPELRRQVLASMRFFRDDSLPVTPILEGMRAADRDPSTGIVLEHELLTCLASGAETSAATTGWMCYVLAAHPQLQDELRVLAKAFWQSDDANWAGLSRLRPIAHLISETLRLYPPTPIIGRLALAPDRIGEREIEAGQNILISFVGIQRDARLRANPWVLDIGDEAMKPGSGEGTAFSFGPRVCGGKQFALVELATILSLFLANASFELTSDDPPRFYWKSQMLRQGGQPVRVRPIADGSLVA